MSSSRTPRMYPCKNCTRRTRSTNGLCIECRPRTRARPPETKCCLCGGRTVARDGICRTCTNAQHAAPTEAHRLTGGRWVNVGGIQRWQPWTPEECAERTRAALARWAA